MSQEIRRVIKQDGVYAFSVISLPDGLSEEDYALGVKMGPNAVEVGIEGGYPAMLAEAGWRVVERIDLTKAYETTIKKMLEQEYTHHDALAELQGEEEVDARIGRRELRVEALERGLVIREQFVARPA